MIYSIILSLVFTVVVSIEINWLEILVVVTLGIVFSYFLLNHLIKYADCKIENDVFRFKTLIDTIAVQPTEITSIHVILKETFQVSLRVYFVKEGQKLFRKIVCRRELEGVDIDPKSLIEAYLNCLDQQK